MPDMLEVRTEDHAGGGQRPLPQRPCQLESQQNIPDQSLLQGVTPLAKEDTIWVKLH